MRERKNNIPESIRIIAQNIKRLMANKELKASDVARIAEIDVETLRRYIGGESPKIVMGTDKLVRIALALELKDYNELFLGIK